MKSIEKATLAKWYSFILLENSLSECNFIACTLYVYSLAYVLLLEFFVCFWYCYCCCSFCLARVSKIMESMDAVTVFMFVDH